MPIKFLVLRGWGSGFLFGGGGKCEFHSYAHGDFLVLRPPRVRKECAPVPWETLSGLFFGLPGPLYWWSLAQSSVAMSPRSLSGPPSPNPKDGLKRSLGATSLAPTSQAKVTNKFESLEIEALSFLPLLSLNPLSFSAKFSCP